MSVFLFFSPFETQGGIVFAVQLPYLSIPCCNTVLGQDLKVLALLTAEVIGV